MKQFVSVKDIWRSLEGIYWWSEFPFHIISCFFPVGYLQASPIHLQVLVRHELVSVNLLKFTLIRVLGLPIHLSDHLHMISKWQLTWRACSSRLDPPFRIQPLPLASGGKWKFVTTQFTIKPDSIGLCIAESCWIVTAHSWCRFSRRLLVCFYYGSLALG